MLETKRIGHGTNDAMRMIDTRSNLVDACNKGDSERHCQAVEIRKEKYLTLKLQFV